MTRRRLSCVPVGSCRPWRPRLANTNPRDQDPPLKAVNGLASDNGWRRSPHAHLKIVQPIPPLALHVDAK